MKIFSGAQIQQWDQYTILSEPISSLELMERAAAASTGWILTFYPGASFSIICAKGNNGGDGLAIARMLIERGKQVQVYILEFGFLGTADFQSNLSRLHSLTPAIHFIQEVSLFPIFPPGEVVIDCIYGSGLNRPPDGILELLIRHINETTHDVVSIDIPTGIFTDRSSLENQKIIATHTLSFQAPKLAFMLPENDDYLGNIHIIDIGLDPEFSKNTNTSFEILNAGSVRAFYKKRKKSAQKGDFGHALIIAGSKGKMGAATLAAKACMRSGAGLLTTIIPYDENQIMQISVPEAMTIAYRSMEEVTAIDFENFTAVGIGPGLGITREKLILVSDLMKKNKRPMLLDADALNCIAQEKEIMTHIPAGSVLTPHQKEFDRLFGPHPDHYARLKSAIKKSNELNCVIVLKGHHSFISSPGGAGYFNSTGNPGMATAGSGDVLSGVITGFLAQGYSGIESALLGVYIHGLAGDICIRSQSMESMIAGDLVDSLGLAFLEIQD